MIRRIVVALCVASVALTALPAASRADFGFVPGSVSATAFNEGERTVDSQSSSHPYSYVVHFELSTDESGTPEGEARNVFVDLPPGFIGNPRAVQSCSAEQFEGGTPQCPLDTQVGVLRATVFGLGLVAGPLYNVAPPPGSPAEIGFTTIGFGSLQLPSVRTEGGYGLRVAALNLPLPPTSVTETIWGVPGDPGHNGERGQAVSSGEGPRSWEGSVLPYLTLPATCGAPLETTIEAESLTAPGAPVAETISSLDVGGTPVSLSGCESVPFAPAVSATPTTIGAESPSGLGFQLKLPNKGLLSPQGIVETEPEKTEVTFPVGVAVNPSAASGIVGCSSAQYAAANGEPGVGCPEASKIGTLVANSPLLEEAIEGSVYLATPHDNQFNSLIAVYFVAKAKERGVLVKQAGEGRLDPSTGQISTTFDHLPPLPYSSLELKLREGPRAPLITPQACGEYGTVAKLYPFSAPGSPVVRTAPFKISSGANGGPCVSGEGQAPSRPTFEAGTVAPVAGSYSPFVFRVRRNDGEQRFSSLQATLPTGLLGRIAGVPFCPGSGIATAGSRTQEGGGAQELSSPSCPAASQVGTVNVAAGAGSQPYNVQGKAYLAGPYEGAPLSLEIITPAVAGPFDLGSVAVRTALYVNEVTAQIHAVSDPLPSVLHGIPLDVRTISLQMDRNEFTLNPTNCQAKSVTGAISTLAGAISALSQPFAVGGCKGLAFKPELKLAFSGQTKRLGNPAIKAVLTQPKGQNANVAGATVTLPKGMFIDQAHINDPCTRVQFNSGALPGEGCPAKSILGTAKVWTPLLEAPEEGKVYFRSNGGERELPDLAVALRGQIPLQLVGFIDSVGKKGAEVRRVRSRFLNLPDAPVSRFELKLSGGRKGLLENSRNLCKGSDLAKFQLTGQNGAAHVTEPKVQVKCGKKGNGGKKKGGGK